MSGKSINEFNADVLVVSRRLGHSSSETTLKTTVNVGIRRQLNLKWECLFNSIFPKLNWTK